MAKTAKEKTTDMSTNNEKLKALKLTIDKIEKDYGKGSVMMMNEKGIHEMEVISTGSIGLDVALGIGGLPRGRVVEIYGPESSGKTTLATHVIAEAQKKGGMCAFIDAEHAFDLSLIHISEPTRQAEISYAVFCLKKKKLKGIERRLM